MKKTAVIITLAAAMVTLTSCGRHTHITSNLDVSSHDTTNSAAVDAADENTTVSNAPSETAEAASGEVNVQTTEAAANGSEGAVQTTESTYTSQPAGQVMETAFNKGKIVGNAYISDLAGLKLVFPENAEFYGKDALYTNFMMPTRFMTEEEKEQYTKSVIDVSVTYGEAGKVNVWYYDLNAKYPETPNMSAEEYLQRYVSDFSQNFEVTDVIGPEKITLCGKEYSKISFNCDSYHTIMYARPLDDGTVLVIDASGIPADDIESRFEVIS